MSREKLIDRLRKVMELQKRGSTEGERTAAAAHLARLLEKHGLEVADLEAAGQSKPGIARTDDIEISTSPANDSTLKWKLALAECVAEHFYCYALINWNRTSIQFIGRPDNIAAMQLLYAWFIRQIKELSTSTRREHIATTDEHIDGLRWQISFAKGAIERLSERLFEERERHATITSTALVVSHTAEISDWAEENMGRRFDGKLTASQEKYRAQAADRLRTYKDGIAADRELLDSNPDAYYEKFPHRHPDAVAKAEMQDEARLRRNRKARERRWANGGASIWDRASASVDYGAEAQNLTANRAGFAAGDRINTSPHVGTTRAKKEIE